MTDPFETSQTKRSRAFSLSREKRAIVFGLLFLSVGAIALVHQMTDPGGGQTDPQPDQSNSAVRDIIRQRYATACDSTSALLPCEEFTTCMAAALRSEAQGQGCSIPTRAVNSESSSSCFVVPGFSEREAEAVARCIQPHLFDSRERWWGSIEPFVLTEEGMDLFQRPEDRQQEVTCIAATTWDMARTNGCDGRSDRTLHIRSRSKTLRIDESLLVRIETLPQER